MKTSTIAKFLLLFIIGIFILLLTSCSTQKRCEWHLSKSKQLGCLKMNNDTVEVEKLIKGDSVYFESKIGIDSNELNSIIDSLKNDCSNKEVIKEIIRKIPINIEPYFKDDSLYRLSVIVEKNKLKVDIKIKDRKIKEKIIFKNVVEIKEKKVIPLSIKIALGVLTLLCLGLVFKK